MSKEHVCPKCGTAVHNATVHDVTFVSATGVVTFEGRTCLLRPTQIDILEHLLDAYPAAITSARLFALVYGDRADCDTPVSNILTTQISDMRKRFKNAGLRLEVGSNKAGYGKHNGYCLMLRTEEHQQVA